MTPDEKHATWGVIMNDWRAILCILDAMDKLLAQVDRRDIGNSLLDLSLKGSVQLVYGAPSDIAAAMTRSE